MAVLRSDWMPFAGTLQCLVACKTRYMRTTLMQSSLQFANKSRRDERAKAQEARQLLVDAVKCYVMMMMTMIMVALIQLFRGHNKEG